MSSRHGCTAFISVSIGRVRFQYRQTPEHPVLLTLPELRQYAGLFHATAATIGNQHAGVLRDLIDREVER